MAGFAALTAAGYHGVARRRTPAVPTSGDVVLLGVATFKLSRLLTKAKVTEAVREPFVERAEPGADGEINAEPVRGAGVRTAVGELLTCPFCVSVWVAAGLVLLHAAEPRAARSVASTFAAVAVADVTQHLNAAAQRLDG